jgi:hypothetical protein
VFDGHIALPQLSAPEKYIASRSRLEHLLDVALQCTFEGREVEQQHNVWAMLLQKIPSFKPGHTISISKLEDLFFKSLGVLPAEDLFQQSLGVLEIIVNKTVL